MIKEVLLLSGMGKKKDDGKAAQSRLSFVFDNMGDGEGFREIEGEMERRISKSSNGYYYLVGDSINGGEIKRMEHSKALVIDALAKSNQEINGSMLKTARELASGFLGRFMDPERASHLSYFVAHDTVGCGPLSILLEDKFNIEEIEINSPSSPIVVYTTAYGRCITNLRFVDESFFRLNINKLIYEAEKELGEGTPIIDAQVSDARIHAQMRPYAMSGAAASIRIGRGKSIGLYDLMKSGLDPALLAYLWLAIDSKLNLVITGAPASGKTTMLSAIASLIPRISKLVTIEEEINELSFNEPIFNVVALYGSRYGAVNTRSQILNALRLRPDRIVLGEVRGEETRELFAGAGLGIPFMTTMHSSDEPLSVVKKLLIKPMSVEPRSLSMLDISVHMKQTGIRARTISEIYEYRWLSRAETEEGVEVGDGDSVDVRKTAENGKTAEEVVISSKVFENYLRIKAVSRRTAIRELRQRIELLQGSLEKSRDQSAFIDNISNYNEEVFS